MYEVDWHDIPTNWLRMTFFSTATLDRSFVQ